MFQKFQDTRLSVRLYSALATYVVLVALLATYNFTNLNSYQSVADRIYLQQFKGTDFLIEADRDSYQSNLALSHLLHFAASGDAAQAAAQVEDIRSNLQQTRERFQGFVAAAGERLPGAAGHIADFEARWQEWQALTDRIVSLAVDSGDSQQAAGLYHDGSYAAVYEPMRDAMDQLTNLVLADAETLYQSTRNLFGQSLAVSVGMVSFVLLFTVALFVLFGIMLFRPIRLLGQRIHDIGQGEGDLTQLVPDSGRNELGDVARGYNEFTQGLRRTIQTLKTRIDQNEDLRRHLDDDTGSVAAAITQISANIASINQQVEGLEAGVIAAGRSMTAANYAMDNLDHQVGRQATALAEMTGSLGRMTTDIDEAAQQAEWKKEDADALQQQSEAGSAILAHARESVGNIEGSLASIREMMGIIAGIASQTNLLAMNAAIEAAHAGEAGRGFAVVADEIRALAENAGKQSKGINQALKKITLDIQNAGEASARSNESFEQIRKRVKHVLSGFASISTSVGRLKSLNVTVQETLAQLEEASSGVGSQSQTSRQEIQAAARQLDQAAAVSRLVKDAMGEINSGTAEIAGAMERLRHVAGDLGDNSRALGEGISHFKA